MRDFAILETLNAKLIASKSATQTLQNWCDDHHIASPAKIRAVKNENIIKPASESVRQALEVSPEEPIKYRSVQLFYSDYLLSEADNWYIPSRLTGDMNHLLNSSDTPFGLAVESLNFHRRTDEVQLLWHPLGRDEPIPEHVLQHRAVLKTEQNIPFSIVIETYTRHIFAFK
jgi:chorismate-pyruvate lyase